MRPTVTNSETIRHNARILRRNLKSIPNSERQALTELYRVPFLLRPVILAVRALESGQLADQGRGPAAGFGPK